MTSTRLISATVILSAVLIFSGCSDTPDGPGLPGRLVGVDDAGLGEYEAGGGALAVVPADRVTDLWDVGGLPGPPADLAHAQFSLGEADVADLDGVVARLTEEGRFRLDAPPGPTVVCWLGPDGDPGVLSSRGCAELDLPDEGALTATWGEGGFGIAVD